MKKSQQANQSNTKSIQSAQQSKTQARTTTKAKNEAKIRGFASSAAFTTSRHFGALSRFSCPATKSTPARHFRANSYVPLLLALRPRAESLVSPDRLIRSGKSDKLSKLTMPVISLALGLTIVSSLLGSVMFPSPASATSLTLSIPAEPLAISITPTQDGTFNSATSKITVKTDAPFGYELKVKSASVDNSLTSSGSSIATVLPSITSAIPEATFKTDTTYNNKWGFKPSKLEGIANDSYQPAPNSTGLLIDKTTQATDLTTGTSYDITIGARVDTTLPAGQYSNIFIITASANARQYSITYDANGGTNSPANVTGQSTIEAVTIDDQEPTYNAYHKFTGWCDRAPTLTKPGNADNVNWYDTCEGTTYQPGNTWLPDSDDATLTLYAMWEEQYTTFDMAYKNAGKEQQTLAGQTYYKMQDMESNICTSVTMPSDRSTTTLIDTRDNNTYTVAKLKDDKCWMTKNLAIGGSTQITLTSEQSDITDNFALPASSTTGFSDDAAINIYIDVTYGGYYSYAAATAGTGNIITSGEASDSVCSKGWKLPTSTELTTLINAYDARYNGLELAQAPVNMLYGGRYDKGSALYQNLAGDYWSSTASNSSAAYNLHFGGAVAYVYDGDHRYGGYSVRCIAH